VCDETNSVAWGLHVGSGRLFRYTRGEDGAVLVCGLPPPAGFPDGHGTRVLANPTGVKSVECTLDTDAGTLAFSVNMGASLLALRGFPRCASMRPWARMACSGGRVRLEAGGARARSITAPVKTLGRAAATACVAPRRKPVRASRQLRSV
jgi:hypothetical protein